jgi:hypothetical protein
MNCQAVRDMPKPTSFQITADEQQCCQQLTRALSPPAKMIGIMTTHLHANTEEEK